MNLAKLLEGPAIITHRGQIFHSRGGAVLTPTAESFAIDTDVYGPVDQRALDNAVALTLTPIGVWSAAQLAVLFRWADPTIGQLVTPRYDIDTVTAGTDVLTLIGTAVPRTGCPVRVDSFGTLPAGLSAATTYYWGAAGTLHATEADALAAADPVDITDGGTGDHVLIEQEPLTIHTFSNRKIVFHNAAITGMPSITHSAVQSLLGPVTFAAFRKNDAAWSAENSLYTITKELLTDTPPDETTIKTQEYSAAWGAAPWDAFKLRGPLTLSSQLATEPIVSDGRGLMGLKIANLTAAATGQPQGFSEEQMLDVLGLQGGAVARGASKVRSDLVITGTGVHNILYNAAARELPQTFSPRDPRAGELAWVGARTPGDAVFYVGTAAP